MCSHPPPLQPLSSQIFFLPPSQTEPAAAEPAAAESAVSDSLVCVSVARPVLFDIRSKQNLQQQNLLFQTAWFVFQSPCCLTSAPNRTWSSRTCCFRRPGSCFSPRAARHPLQTQPAVAEPVVSDGLVRVFVGRPVLLEIRRQQNLQYQNLLSQTAGWVAGWLGGWVAGWLGGQETETPP